MDRESNLEQARRILAGVKNFAALTGAGVSAESGIPTFRDAQSGLWAKYDPVQLASPAGFRADPALVWRWYDSRRARVRVAQPNAGHFALAAVEARFSRFALITQNVDGLHARAGSRAPLELHGNILRTKCFDQCGAVFGESDPLPPGEPPRCPRCGGWLRPDVVWFGEMLDPAVMEQAEDAAAKCDLMLVVGTSGLVYPAAGLPIAAKRRGAKVVIVNPDSTELDSIADIVLQGRSAVVLPRLLS